MSLRAVRFRLSKLDDAVAPFAWATMSPARMFKVLQVLSALTCDAGASSERERAEEFLAERWVEEEAERVTGRARSATKRKRETKGVARAAGE